jgi:hypothetical protein
MTPLTPVTPCALPRNWERAYGYPGTARWIAVYWEPGCDEAMYEDGLMSGMANYMPYNDLIGRYRLQITMALQEVGVCTTANALNARWLLGSSDERATYKLVMDLLNRKIYVAPEDSATKFVKEQRVIPPPVEFEVPDDIDEWLKSLQEFPQVPSGTRFAICTCQHGWVRGKDGGYDPCPKQCDGGIIWEKADEQNH